VRKITTGKGQIPKRPVRPLRPMATATVTPMASAPRAAPPP